MPCPKQRVAKPEGQAGVSNKKHENKTQKYSRSLRVTWGARSFPPIRACKELGIAPLPLGKGLLLKSSNHSFGKVISIANLPYSSISEG